MMYDVGIRELRSNLADVLERASRGERIRITERGEPKALLISLPGTDRLQAGFEEGWVTRGPAWGEPLPQLSSPRARPRPGITTQSIIDEDRGS